MGAPPLVKITAVTAAEICARFQLRNESLALLREGMGPRDFVEALLAHQQYVAGIDFLAHALPPREGIWWGCLCLQHACGDDLPPADRGAAIAAVLWVWRPGEDTRTAAGPAAQGAGPASVAGALASAAFLTGGNVAPPKAPPSPPAPFAAAKAVAQAVKIASIKVPPAKITDTQRALVELGIGIAEGRYI
jgi:Family of unknown function (DUF6931)